MQPQKLTKTRVDHVAIPPRGQKFLRDTELKGFALRVTNSGAKSFVVEKRVEGKVRRLTLGHYPDLTVEQARREAQKLLGAIALGRNPIIEKHHAQLQRTTLGEAFKDFLSARKNLKPHTVYDYGLVMRLAFGDWQSRALIDITKDHVAKRHRDLGARRGEAYANLSMRVLRAVINFAMAQYEDGFGNPLLVVNPVSRLTQTRAWYRVNRRQTVIRPHQLADWYAGVNALRELNSEAATTVADYLLLLLLTGLRRQEGAQLRWRDVDLKARTLTVHDPKNHEPLTLPLSDHVEALLLSRAKRAESPFVFPGSGRTGYLADPRKQKAKVVAHSGVNFTLHDLRRTFITIADSIDTSAYAIKRLVNHKMQNDVTAGYIITDIERLRSPMQLINDFILRAAGAIPTATIETIGPSRRRQGLYVGHFKVPSRPIEGTYKETARKHQGNSAQHLRNTLTIVEAVSGSTRD